jgi:hypothetical protein
MANEPTLGFTGNFMFFSNPVVQASAIARYTRPKAATPTAMPADATPER